MNPLAEPPLDPRLLPADHRSTPTSAVQSPVPYLVSSGDQLNHVSPAQDDLKRPRACEACRNLKVRCDHDPARPDKPCHRCSKAKRQCVFTEPSRKRRKRSETRVAELERKLDFLTAALQAQQPPPTFKNAYGPSTSSSLPQSAAVQSPHKVPPPSAAQSPASYSLPPLTATNSLTPPSRQSFAEPEVPRQRNPSATPRSSISHQSTYPNVGDALPRPPMMQQQSVHTPATVEADRDDGPTVLSDKLQTEQNGRKAYHVSPDIMVHRIREILDPRQHDLILHRFVHDMAPRMPIIVISPQTTASELLEDRPVLFLCILLAACGNFVTPEKHREIEREAVDTLADCIIRSGSKSLEIVQAILVHVLWYNPANKNSQQNSYTFAQTASCMALDIGLGRKGATKNIRMGFGMNQKDMAPALLCMVADPESIEARRTWLATYYVAASAARMRRRPRMLKCTRFSEECMDVLEKSPDAAPSDRFLVQHVRIQKIGDEITDAFSMDDASAPAITIKDPKVLWCIETYEKKLDDWKEKLDDDMKRDASLMFMYEGMQIFLHEVAMHVNHNLDDFRLPFTEESLKSGSQYTDSLTQQQMAALGACLRASHQVLDYISTFELMTWSNSPKLLYFAECAYALVVLIKLHLAVSQPGSQIAKFISIEDIRAFYWMDKICATFEQLTSMAYSTHMAHKASKILTLTRGWLMSLQRETAGHKIPQAGQGGETAAYTPTSTYDGTGGSKLHVLSDAATADAQRYNIKESAPMYSNTSHGHALHSAGHAQSMNMQGPGLDFPIIDFNEQQGIDWLAFPPFDGLLADGTQGLDWIMGDGLSGY